MALPLVVDAGVALKWFFRGADEPDASIALDVLAAVAHGRVRLLQPPHFIAEVGAVLARESPESAEADLVDLLQIRLCVVSDEFVHLRALSLATRLGHHMFDTLYHAVALEREGAVLITADDRYFRKAHALGRIVRLASASAILEP